MNGDRKEKMEGPHIQKMSLSDVQKIVLHRE